MKLIVGLGNPGKKYEQNRHNLGFLVLDAYAREEGLSWRYNPEWLCYFVKTNNFVLMKPSTFMNKSGIAVAAAANFYKAEPEDVLVVYDEVDLPFGKIRLAINGLSAGHHGIESVIESLGTVDFARLRVGVDHPRNNEGEAAKEVADYVLENFLPEEKKELEGIIKKGNEAIRAYVAEGIEGTMNKFN